MSRLDLVIFGATGFTGRHAAEEAARIAQRDRSLCWGVAGRSRSKLEQLLQRVKDRTGEDVSNVRVIIAEVDDEESLKAMTGQAKVIVNCCGPYRHYGEPVVQACLATGTHHVDVSGEPQYMERMQLQYHKRAEQAGVYIVSSCGFDCIPNDLGVVYLKENFKGVLNSVESYIMLDIPKDLRSLFTPSFHYGTWESLVYSLAHWDELRMLRKIMYPDKIPSCKPTLKSRFIIHKSGDNWFMPFVGADKSVVYRTQRYFYDTKKQRPVQFKPYIGLPSFLAAIFTMFFGVVLYIMSKTEATRRLLLEYPRIFSLGLASHDGPSEDQMKKTTFAVYLRGQGWDESVTDINSAQPDKIMTAKVSGVNPGYGATVVSLLHSGLTILKEHDKMPGKGGVLTTGVAFAKTSLIRTLHENNFLFQIVEQ